MKNCILLVLALFATLIYQPANCFAQSTAFTYQGRLDDGGSQASGSYDLTFALYDAAGDGAQQGFTLTNSATAISNGLFTVTLDFGNQFPGADRWLEIGVRTNGGGAFSTLAPRQLLTATPYAVRAASAATAATASSVNAANISGLISVAQLPANVVTNGASGVNFSGTFTGNGAGMTNVDLITINSHGALGFLTNSVFSLASSPTVGSGSYSVTTADVNGDGKTDLISANSGNNTLTVLTNTGGITGVFTGNGSGLTSISDTALSANVSKLGSSIESSEITDGTIVDADISPSAAIADTKLATLSTAGKVADTALSANVALLNRSPQAFTGGTNSFTGRVGIGTATPGALLHLDSTTQTAERLRLSGTEFFTGGNSSTEGISFLAGVNRSENRQLWIGDSARLAINSVNPVIRIIPGTTGAIDAVATDGNTPLPISLGGGSSLVVNTNGRVGIGTANPASPLQVNGEARATVFTPTSDRNAKENFAIVNPAEVLAKVAALPISEWNYKTMTNARHVGPMAQDFRAAFGLGSDDKGISTVDADGVALAAIQGLNQKLEEQKAENAELKARLEKLERLLVERLHGGGK